MAAEEPPTAPAAEPPAPAAEPPASADDKPAAPIPTTDEVMTTEYILNLMQTSVPTVHHLSVAPLEVIQGKDPASGATLAHWAAMMGQVDVLKRLKSRGGAYCIPSRWVSPFI